MHGIQFHIIANKDGARMENPLKKPARVTFYEAKGGARGCEIEAQAFEFVDPLIQRAVEKRFGVLEINDFYCWVFAGKSTA